MNAPTNPFKYEMKLIGGYVVEVAFKRFTLHFVELFEIYSLLLTTDAVSTLGSFKYNTTSH